MKSSLFHFVFGYFEIYIDIFAGLFLRKVKTFRVDQYDFIPRFNIAMV